jgi:hypothetical protein
MYWRWASDKLDNGCAVAEPPSTIPAIAVRKKSLLVRLLLKTDFFD